VDGRHGAGDPGGAAEKHPDRSVQEGKEVFHKVTLPMISKAVVPMIIACLVVLIVVTYVPQISLLLVPKG
jgi:hypothetical protein